MEDGVKNGLEVYPLAQTIRGDEHPALLGRDFFDFGSPLIVAEMFAIIRAMVLFPAPAGPSMATIIVFFPVLLSRRSISGAVSGPHYV